MVLSRGSLPERVSGEGRGWLMACGGCTAIRALALLALKARLEGKHGGGGGVGGGDQDVLSRYLANRSSSLVLVAGFCC